ncbi:MAG TPA: wax ester/triacylglycerol synthase domain-containing protein [Solirubrobacterales bacterium]|nr:wax ester/triacylglycerol synthase domain-containing protein [Solirubrobacterales bacterium]
MGKATRERLSQDDAQILRLESAVIKGHTGKVVVIAPGSDGRALSIERLRDQVGERMAAFPRLGERIEEPRFGLGRPAWVEAPDVDLTWHLAMAERADPLSDEELRRAVGELISERLDHTRPLWRLDALPLTGERVALVGRIHHAMADGVSAIRLLAGVLWDANGEPAQPSDRKQAGTVSRSGGESSSPGARPAAPEARETRIVVRLPSALWRELRPGRDTKLDQHIGPAREVAWTSFPLERLKRIGHGAAGHATVNDVVLAVVAGALRRWLPQAGGIADDLRVQCPVCLHAREEAEGQLGNRDSFMNLDLPISEPDPAARLRTINTETSERKLDHDPDALYAFFHALGRFRPLYRGVTRLTSGPREFALSVSNVPGPRRRPLVLGHAIEQFCSFAEPADRHALRLSIVSLGGELAFGLCSDPDAITDLDRLRGALADSIGELEVAV